MRADKGIKSQRGKGNTYRSRRTHTTTTLNRSLGLWSIYVVGRRADCSSSFHIYDLSHA